MELGSTGQQTRKLKKGELLFKEGDKSRSMYLLKSGMIRLFTRRGNANIEIDTIRPGQILGELAFLDGNPRSLSGEALIDCELVEISGPMFLEVLSRTPDWLKLLLKTVVGRLRAANTRIRQLESTSGSINYSDKDGGKRASYQYLSYVDFMKAATGLLLVGTRNGKKIDSGTDVDLGTVNRYAHFVMGVPIAKVESVIDILVQAGLATTREENGNPRATLKNVDILEGFIAFLNEENLLDPAKRHDISAKGFIIMSLIVNSLPSIPRDAGGLAIVDIVAVKNAAMAGGAREPFRNDEANELVKLGYISELRIKSQLQILTTVNPDAFVKAFRRMQIVTGIKTINEQKNKVGGGK